MAIGGGLGAGFLGFGLGAVPSPDAAAVADPPSLAASLRALAFGFGAASSVAADDDAPSLAPSLAPSFAAGDLGFGFGAAREVAALVGDASYLSFAVGLIAAAFFFSGFFSSFDSVASCAPGAGGLVPV